MQPNPGLPIEGQLNTQERELLVRAVRCAAQPPKVAVEVGTWLGGGSTLHILRALEANACGHLWGVEANRAIYDRMLGNLKAGAPETLHRFTPLFGLSHDVIPKWLAQQPPDFKIDFAFLDGGNNPMEQITEFRLIAPRMPVGGQLMAHDAKYRKGKWLVPYITALDNWQAQVHDISSEGLLHSTKMAPEPSPASLKTANALLLKLRLNPAELASALLPAAICGFILRLLPRRLSMKLSDGRELPRE